MINKIIPTSLFKRFILIIAIPIVLAQLIATYIFYNRHWESVSKNMSSSLSNDIKIIFELEKQNLQVSKRQELYNKIGIDFKIFSKKKKGMVVDYYDPEAEYLYHSLKELYSLPIQIKFIDDKDNIQVEIFQETSILRFITNAKRIYNPTTYIFILWMTGTSFIFIFLSIVFAHSQIRPIIKLARAADRFGKGQHSIDLKLEGAKEIRKAASAFLKMKERIERQINYRTEMLAGVSHDLRTPLTRMKLQLALSDHEANKSLIEDIRDMELMINSYLEFARGSGKENVKTLWLDKFISKIVSIYIKQNCDVQIKLIPHIKMTLRIDAIKRCLQNLLDNSFKYANKVVINGYFNDQDEVYIEVHDDGPGIPIEKREEVFKPFYRIEESRNKETGGVGLGLAITRDIISNHGGRIYMEDSEILKGLKAVIVLPI